MKRIVTAREQLELLSPWRQAAQEPSPFPWARDDRDWAYGEHGLYHPDTEAYHAPLENGHRLRVWDDSMTDPGWAQEAEAPGSHWKGGFDHGIDQAFDPEAFAAAGYPSNWHPKYTAVYDNNSPLRAKAYPSKEHAMRAVEKKYQEMFPLGTDTGPHDSGIDYSDLNKFMGEL